LTGSVPLQSRVRVVLITAMVAIALIAGIIGEVVWTRPERESVGTFTELIDAANLPDLSRARRLCSASYLRRHALEAAPEGGLVGLPRTIHKNFQAWRHGQNVWLCPSNRIGPVFQFVFEDGRWKFDGPIGLLQARGRFVRSPDDSEMPASDQPE